LQVTGDGHYVLELNCHLAALLAGLPQAHLTPEQREDFARQSDAEIARRADLIAAYLAETIVVSIDSEPRALPRAEFPTVADIRRDATQTPEDNFPSAPIIFRGELTPGAQEVSVTFPSELGTVLLQFVSPGRTGGLRTVVQGTGSGPLSLRGDEKTKGVAAAVLNYLRLGATHILGGADQLAVLVGLLLLVRSRMALLKIASVFAAAHSLTISLAALGLVRVPESLVELGIALSILVLGIESQRRGEKGRYPWIMVFGFGLLHGMGLAIGLSLAGLSASELPLMLLAFTLGIEAGQIGFLISVLLLCWAWRRLGFGGVAAITHAASWAVMVFGALWTARVITAAL
jgi:hypothetical protein